MQIIAQFKKNKRNELNQNNKYKNTLSHDTETTSTVI